MTRPLTPVGITALGATIAAGLGRVADPMSTVTAAVGPSTWAAGADPEHAVAVAAAALAWLVLSWLGLGVALVLAARLPGAGGVVARVAARRVLPAALRRALGAGVGVSLVVGAAAPAHAATAPPSPPAAPPVAVSVSVDAGPFERPVPVPAPAVPAAAVPTVTPTPRSTPTPAGGAVVTATPREAVLAPVGADLPEPAPVVPEDVPAPRPPSAVGASIAPVVVVPGDTLWAIAKRTLPAGASDAEVDRTWRRWYAANASVVGADPDLIHPGQRLRPPAR